MHNAAGLLRRYQVLASKDPDEVQAFMHRGQQFFDVSPRDAERLDLDARQARLPSSKITCVSYGAPVLAAPRADRAPEEFLINFSLRGSSEIANGVHSFACDPKRSAVISSTEGYVMRSAAESERLRFSVSRAAVTTQLEAMLGEPMSRKLEFVPDLDLESPHGRRLRRRLDLVISDLEQAEPEGLSPLLLNMTEQSIVAELLLYQPSNYTAALHRLENKVVPGDVKRAIDFIEAHLQLPLTLADIAAASGAPGRTLLEHFKSHCGISPMRYVRNARLARVRGALMRADRTGSVTRIAMEWGFQHLGRFAIDYRSQFGESPSETVGRGGAADD